MTDHYAGKSPIEHVAERKAEGLLSGAETHGTEIPGHIHSFADVLRQSSLLLLLHWMLLRAAGVSLDLMWPLMGAFLAGWFFWNAGRATWLGFSRLERMHRIVEQERYEIKHHRGQEREELAELYRAKGLEGKLLEDVLDVFMADDERLLRVMVDEELCLSLGTHVHPLQQGLGAGLAVVVAGVLGAFFSYLFPGYGLYISTVFGILCGTLLSTYYEKNKIVSAIVWLLGIALISAGTVYFLLQAFHAH